jgi:hypothetical protein
LLVALAPALAVGLLLAAPALAASESPSPVAETPAPGEQTERDQVSFGTNLVIVPGQTTRDVFCLGCSVTVEPGASVGRDLVVFGGTADVEGSVGRDAFVMGGSLHLGATANVQRDAVSLGGRTEITPGAHVGRDQTSFGSPHYDFLPGPPSQSGIFPGVFLVALAVLALLIFPRQLEVTASLIEARPGTSLGLGCLTITAAVAGSILMAITVILIPVSLAIALAVAAAWLFGWAAIYLITGRRLLAALDRSAQPLVALVVGGAFFVLLGLIPVVGSLLVFLGGAVALGAAAGSRFGTRREQSDFFAWRTPPSQPLHPVPVPPPDPPEGHI